MAIKRIKVNLTFKIDRIDFASWDTSNACIEFSQPCGMLKKLILINEGLWM